MPNKFIVDGLNICKEDGKKARLTILLSLMLELKKNGYDFLCVFDVSAYHEFSSQRQGIFYNNLLRYKPKYYFWQPKGDTTKADVKVLSFADADNCQIISNDKYSEYRDLKEYEWLKNDPNKRLEVSVNRGWIFLEGTNVKTRENKDLNVVWNELKSYLDAENIQGNGNDNSVNKPKENTLPTIQTNTPPISKTKNVEDKTVSNIATQPIVVKPKPRTKADIVFCVDSTESMQRCIDGVKAGLNCFIDGLQSAANVDFRLRLIAYRDLHDPSCNVAWNEFDFTSDIEVFRSRLSEIEAKCGQIRRGAESTLDAIYLAIHSEWRDESRIHKTIVVLTDDDTHPTLHPSTFSGEETRPHIRLVIEDFNKMSEDKSSSILFMVAPKYPLYAEIAQGLKDANRDFIWQVVDTNDKQHYGLHNIDSWDVLLKMLGKTISSSSITCQNKSSDT